MNLINAILETVDSISNDEDKKNYIGMKRAVRRAIEYLQIGMFPAFVGKDFSICTDCTQGTCTGSPVKERRIIAFQNASEELLSALVCIMDKEKAMDVVTELIRRIPSVKMMLTYDIQAAYEGDPAAMSTDDIILAYPAFTAISTYRIAHELYLMSVPTIPRMMTEFAHEMTGIDINPGATIGPYFFIDHGTGVVIGETTTIGAHVKIYQNVTLGAKSFEVEPDGSLVKGIKRHPDIGDNVVIYAGATILGGDTKIGENCTIGGNVWLTSSVPAGTKVTQLYNRRIKPAEV